VAHEEIQREVDPKLAEEAEKNLRNAGPLLETGDPKKALKYFARAAKGFEMRHDPMSECNALDGMAEAYEKMGAPQQALTVANKALEIAREIKDMRAQARQLRRMASIYVAGEKPRKALECYRRCMEFHHALGNRLGELEDLENLARLYDQLGNGDKTKKCLGRVEEVARHLPDEKEKAKHLYAAAMIYRSIQGLDKTAALLVDVAEIATRFGMTELLEHCQSELAALGGDEEVVEIGDDAVEAVEDLAEAEETEEPSTPETAAPSGGDARRADEAKNKYNEGPPIEGIPLWEYRIVVDRGRMHRVTIQELDQVGAQGWEMIHILKAGTESNPETIYMFKRCGGYAPAAAAHARAPNPAAQKVESEAAAEEHSLSASDPLETGGHELLKDKSSAP